MIELDQMLDTSAFNGTLNPVGEEGLQTKYMLLNTAAVLWLDKWAEYATNVNYYAGNLIGQKKLDEIRKSGRDPWELNITQPVLDHIMGEFVSNPKKWKVTPKDRASVPKMALAEKSMNAIADANNWKAHKRKAFFADGMIGNLGVAGIEINSVNADTDEVKLFRGDPLEFMIDPAFREYDLSDARWIYRCCKRTLPEALVLYPDKEDILQKYMAWMQDDWTQLSWWYEQGNMNLYDQHYIPISEFYERRQFMVYTLLDPNSDEDPIHECDNQEDAYAEFQKRLALYKQKEAATMGQWQFEQMAIQMAIVPKVIETCFIGWDILDERVLDQEFFPYTFFFSQFYNGAFWSQTDKLRPAQDFYLKQVMQMDYSVGVAVKGAIAVDIQALGESWTFEDFKKNISRTGAVVPLKPGRKATDAIQQIQNGQFNPQMMDLIQIALQQRNMVTPEADIAAAPMGAQGGAPQQSGKALNIQKANAGTGREAMYDNWDYTEKLLGEKLLYTLQHQVSKPIELVVMGQAGAMEWLTLNTSPADTLYDERFIVSVDDQDYSVTSKADQNRSFMEIMASPAFQEFVQMFPMAYLPVYEGWVMTSDYPENVQQTLIQGMQAALQAGMAPPNQPPQPNGGSSASPQPNTKPPAQLNVGGVHVHTKAA